MSMLSQIRACFFDVNGVLIDSNLANAQAMAEAFGGDRRLQEKIVRLYLRLTGIDRGSKIRIIQEQLLGVPFAEGEFGLRWARFKELGKHAMLSAPLKEGCKEVLVALGSRGIMRIALSNTPGSELHETLAAHGLRQLLDRIEGGGDWPKSESLRRLLEEFPFALPECLFFGDGKGDLAAARSNGMPFVAIASDPEEFMAEEGFAGPYPSLLAWAEEALKDE